MTHLINVLRVLSLGDFNNNDINGNMKDEGKLIFLVHFYMFIVT